MYFTNVGDAIHHSLVALKMVGVEVDAGHWQGVKTEGKPDLITIEMTDLRWAALMPQAEREAASLIKPNMPWAEDHFQERVGRKPTNPGVTFRDWPWWKGQDAATMDESLQFTHTYQERFWPKEAGGRGGYPPSIQHSGIRYRYGDLDDVVNLLRREPQTRQAYFPIFFPEDTGAVHGGRIPCSLGYHFMLRGQQLHCWYDIRSCDAIRHFRDDIYLSVRLVQWVLQELQEHEVSSTPDGPTVDSVWYQVEPGNLYFSAHSFHYFKGDAHLL